jgi:hypothetical protein
VLGHCEPGVNRVVLRDETYLGQLSLIGGRAPAQDLDRASRRCQQPDSELQ